MKRTRELTATHYRRSIKRSASESASTNIPNVDLPLRCPICGALLSAGLAMESEEKAGAKAMHVCTPARKNGTTKTDSRSTRNGSTWQKPESLGED
jgi:hypothetical protein